MIRFHIFRKKRVCTAIIWRRHATMTLTLILILLVSGCAVPTAQPPDNLQPTKTAEDQQALDRGIEAFQTGDYRKAGKLFAETSFSTDPLISRQAFYGLTCTRLVLANTPRQYAAALAQWQSWSRQAPLKYHVEDPRLLSPLLDRLAPQGEKKSQPVDEKTPVNKSDTFSLKRYKACEGRVNELEEHIKGLESQKRLLRYYVDYTARLEKEILNLKHQIQSLEAIDKKILEKKKEISSP